MATDVTVLAIGLASLFWIAKLVLLLAALALLETWMAKMRIFRVPEYLGIAFLLAILGMLTHYILEVSV